jgi:hypothetical protein
MLDGKRKDDGTVMRCGVGLGACFMAGEKNFAEAPVLKTRDGRAVMEPVNLEVERHGCASAWQALAHGDSGGMAHLADLLNGGPRAGCVESRRRLFERELVNPHLVSFTAAATVRAAVLLWCAWSVLGLVGGRRGCVGNSRDGPCIQARHGVNGEPAVGALEPRPLALHGQFRERLLRTGEAKFFGHISSRVGSAQIKRFRLRSRFVLHRATLPLWTDHIPSVEWRDIPQ